jgi:hypothetical protein
MAQIEVATYLDATPESVRDHVKQPRLLVYVTSGLLRFRPVDPPDFPEHWSEGQYRVRMMMFGFIPIGWQDISIEHPGSDDEWIVRDNGSGSIAHVWDHLIYASPEGTGTRYVDRVKIQAGWLTPFVALFARLFYGYRQYRWRRLVSNGFDYDL